LPSAYLLWCALTKPYLVGLEPTALVGVPSVFPVYTGLERQFL